MGGRFLYQVKTNRYIKDKFIHILTHDSKKNPLNIASSAKLSFTT